MDFLQTAMNLNIARIGSAISYECDRNFLKEQLSYCMSNNIISEDLAKDPFFKDKIVSKCDKLIMNNPYKSLGLQHEIIYWSHELYKIKLPDGFKLKGVCREVCNMFHVINNEDAIIATFPFFKNYDSRIPNWLDNFIEI
jgi:hypothetical protein